MKLTLTPRDAARVEPLEEGNGVLSGESAAEHLQVGGTEGRVVQKKGRESLEEQIGRVGVHVEGRNADNRTSTSEFDQKIARPGDLTVQCGERLCVVRGH